MKRIEERTKLSHVTVVDYIDYDEEFIYDDESDKYFSCIDTMEDYYKDNNLEMPKYAYGCKLINFSLNLDNILEIESDEFDDDILDRLDGVEELSDAIDKFNKKNISSGSYFEDLNTIVKLF